VDVFGLWAVTVLCFAGVLALIRQDEKRHWQRVEQELAVLEGHMKDITDFAWNEGYRDGLNRGRKIMQESITGELNGASEYGSAR
jgi:hypothetical protein